MGFDVTFNWVVVLKKDLPKEFRHYVSSLDSYGDDTGFVFTKAGHRIYPVGQRVPVAFDDKENLVGSAFIKSCEMALDDRSKAPVTTVILSHPQLE